MSPAEELDREPNASNHSTIPFQSEPKSLISESSHVDKIRDILFGSQMRDYDSRFQKLEQNLAKDSAELKDEVRRRIQVLEDFVRREFELMQTRLGREREERSEADRRLADELKAANESLSAKLHEVEEAGYEAQRRLHDEMFQQSKNLRDDIQSSQEHVLAALEARIQELKNAKIDRANLATMLTEVAMKLTGDFRIPEN